jgi:hypothetical protein
MGSNYTNTLDRDFLLFQESYPDEARIIMRSASYFRVKPLWKNVNAQIMKCDVEGKFPSGPVIDRTVELVTAFLRYMTSSPDVSEDNHEYDLAKSPGLPFSKERIRTKGKVYTHHLPRLMKYVKDLKYPAIDSYNDKDELLDIEDLKRNKVRGVFGGSFHGVIRERILYGGQNKAILENSHTGWIKYGLVKQYGGFSKALRELEPYSFVWESDCSGFDRRVNLTLVYKVRNSLLVNIEGFEEMIESVTQNNIKPIVLLPNGYIVERQTGNDSGKNNTTVDNCIAHFIMMIYLFVKRCVELGIEPKLSFIFSKAHLLIYSDDKIGGTDLETWGFESPAEFLEYERNVYEEFGMECKPSSQYSTLKAPGDRIDPNHSFLGSFASFNESANMYVPYPRFGKICSSIVQKYPEQDELIRFMRALDLTICSFPNVEVFNSFIKYLEWYYDKNPAKSWMFDEILSTAEISTKSRDTFSRIYMGFETRGPGLHDQIRR